ncbi:MAG: hypothetical protein DKM50_01305 [Candidatus Margulisiibacteriota bacterium]|nr:MAG: hypothetical protein DKM50_01305 [Candidatus Margulisiibacteriota bacterium]
MNINTDINVIGSISDLSIIANIINAGSGNTPASPNDLSNTTLKTTRSLQRYERAVKNTLVYFKNDEIKVLFNTVYEKEGLSENSLSMLFLNVSFNNDLLDYFNQSIYFPAYFSGRIAIKKSEVIACIQDLKQREDALKKWSDSTIDVTARKYLALLSKFNLLEGGRSKTISHKYIDDKQLIIFLYWLSKVEIRSNLLESKWLAYCLLDKEAFIARVLQKNLMKYFDVSYTGNSLKLETQISYKEMYNELTKS